MKGEKYDLKLYSKNKKLRASLMIFMEEINFNRNYLVYKLVLH